MGFKFLVSLSNKLQSFTRSSFFKILIFILVLLGWTSSSFFLKHFISFSEPENRVDDTLYTLFSKEILRDQFREYDNKSIIFFNCYRTGFNKFSSAGMIKRSRDSIDFFSLNMGKCIWKDFNNKNDNKKNDDDGNYVWGDMKIIFPGDHHHKHYEAAIIECTFTLPNDPGSLNFGEIFIQFSSKTFQMCEGIQTQEKFLVHLDNDESTKNDFRFEVGYCSPPTFGHLNEIALLQWLEYHIYIGIQWFVFYDAGIVKTSFPNVIGSYPQVEVINATNIQTYDVWNYGQVLTNNDCHMRMRKEAKWILFTDLDEYITLPAPNLSLPSFLTPYEGKVCLSFGSLFWSVNHCLQIDGVDQKWPFEYLILRESNFKCAVNWAPPELCPSHYGHRKVVAYTPISEVVLMHDCLWPLNETTVDLNATTLAYLSHYRGLTSIDFGQGQPLCDKSYPASALPVADLVLDNSNAEFAKLMSKPRPSV